MHRLVWLLAACGTAAPPPISLPAPTDSAPRPVVLGGRPDTPCFPGSRPLSAFDIHEQLEAHAWSMYLNPDEQQPLPRLWGLCRVEGNAIRDAAGELVAELHCGVRVVRRGITDGHGIEIGARGQDVLDSLRARGALTPMRCVSNGPDAVRCVFDRREGSETDPSSYVVAGELGEDVLTGEAATEFFAPRELTEMLVSVWCH
jgi:hypothetical protein